MVDEDNTPRCSDSLSWTGLTTRRVRYAVYTVVPLYCPLAQSVTPLRTTWMTDEPDQPVLRRWP